jgi:hypothetical protein
MYYVRSFLAIYKDLHRNFGYSRKAAVKDAWWTAKLEYHND